jgi:hypothetical protein
LQQALASGFFNVVFLPEPLNPSGGVNQLLLAGEEGVAGRANFHLYIFNGGTGLDYVPAGAGDFGHLVLGMNLLFHVKTSCVAQPLTVAGVLHSKTPTRKSERFS